MGLAISLVATEKERVWFCQKNVKGRGPGGRAPPCDDTRDYDKGGNCVWYDERYVCMYVFLCICIYVCIYICMYI